MADLKPDGQKELKNGVFMLFPRVFGCTKFLSKIFGLYQAKIHSNLGTYASNSGCWVHDSIMNI